MVMSNFTIIRMFTNNNVIAICAMLRIFTLHWICVDNYASNDIFGFAVSPGLTKILPIEKCIFFLDTLYCKQLSEYNLTLLSQDASLAQSYTI